MQLICWAVVHRIVIVIVNSRFLERPQKRSRRNQLIHRRLTKTRSTGSGQDPENQAGRQSDGYGGCCLELRRGGRYGETLSARKLFLTDDPFMKNLKITPYNLASSK